MLNEVALQLQAKHQFGLSLSSNARHIAFKYVLDRQIFSQLELKRVHVHVWYLVYRVSHVHFVSVQLSVFVTYAEALVGSYNIVLPALRPINLVRPELQRGTVSLWEAILPRLRWGDQWNGFPCRAHYPLYASLSACVQKCCLCVFSVQMFQTYILYKCIQLTVVIVVSVVQLAVCSY